MSTFSAALGVVGLLAGVADAHPRLVATTPAANTATAPVSKVQLKFSERLIGPMTSAAVLMTGMPGKPHHAPFKMGGFGTSIGADGKTLMLSRSKPLPAGQYSVAWRAVSVDTHRVAGYFNFTVR